MSTYQITPAQDVCGSIPVCGPIPAIIEGGLTCTPIGKLSEGGFPRAGGLIQFQFWSDICPPATQPSLNLCFGNPLYLRMCAAQPAQGNEYDPTKWITDFAYFGTKTSVQGTSAQFRARAIITVPTQTTLTVNIIIDFLTEDALSNAFWTSWLNVTNTMDLQGTYGKIIGLAYKSNPEYIPVTPSGAGPNCEVTYLSMIAGIQPSLYGCGDGSGDQTCGFWNGNNFYTCFRGELFSNSNAQYPKPFLCGMNPTGCGATGVGFCGCDECQLTGTGTTYDCQFNNDPTFVSYLNTGFESVGDVQQLQLAADTSPLNIMVKSINGILYFYWRNPSISSTWSRSTGTIVRDDSLTIWQVSDSDWTMYFYSMKYPNEYIMPVCNQPTLYTTEPPMPTTSGMNVIAAKLTREQRLATRANGGGCGCNKKK
jgi:hypothetical protein